MKQIHQKLLKKIDQLFENSESSFSGNSPMQLIDIMQMEDGLRRENLITNELNFDLVKIKDKLQSVRVGQKISFCYVYLRKIIVQLQENRDKDAVETPYSKSSSLKIELPVQKFEIISYLIDTIEEISSLSKSQQFNLEFFSQIFFDIVNIYLTTYKCFVKSQLGHLTQQTEQQYRRGEELIKKLEQMVVSQEIFTLKKQIYDFRFISLMHFKIGNAKKLTLQIFNNFIDYYFSNNEKLVQLYSFEYHSKYLFLDYILQDFSDSKIFSEIYQKITDLNVTYPDHFYLLEMKWKFYIQYMRYSKESIENELQIIKSDIQYQKGWEYSFQQLSFYDSRRIIQIFKKVASLKQNENLTVLEISTSWIQMMVSQIIKIDTMRFDEKNTESNLMLQISLLNSITEIQTEIQSVKDILRNLLRQLMESKLSSKVAKKTLQLVLKNQKMFDDVLDIFELAKHIYYKWKAQDFFDDEQQTVAFLQICSENYDQLSLINVTIFGQVIKGYSNKISNDDIPIGRLFSLFQRYSEVLRSKNNKNCFLIDQIRLIIRSCLCCYSVREATIQSPRDMNSSEFIYQHCPLLNLRTKIQDSVEQVIQFSRENFIIFDPLPDFLKSIFELIRQVGIYDQEELYDIVICVLKLIYVHLKWVSQKKEDCTQLNLAFNPIQSIVYKLIVKFMLENEKDSKQINNIMSALLRIVNEADNFQDLKLTFQNSKPYYNWKFLEIQISVIFECSLSVDFKKKYLSELASILHKNKSVTLIFSPILEKLILLLATENSSDISNSIVAIINAISKVKLTVVQFNQLLRLCLANSQKSLIFSNLIPQYQPYLKPLQEKVMQYHCISIFHEAQLSLISKYNFPAVSLNVLRILDNLTQQIEKNKKKQKCFLLFKDLNSKIYLSTNLNVNKGFTLYFEVKFCKSQDVKITAFEAVSYSNFYLETHFSEFSTIYFNDEESKDCSGIKILIQPYQLKILYFNLQKKNTEEKPNLSLQTQLFKINEPIQGNKFRYRLTYDSKEQFKCYINDIKCESGNEQIKTNIRKFTKVDLGHSVQTEQSLSLILSTIAFELQETSFKGNLYQFYIFNQVIQQNNSEKWSIKLSMESQDFSVQYNTSFVGLQDQEFAFEQKQEKENEYEILQLEHTVKQVSQIIKSLLLQIFKIQKAPLFIMLILEEIVSFQKNGRGETVNEMEKITEGYLSLLLEKVINLDDQLFCQFFDHLQYFGQILNGILEKQDCRMVLQILRKFLDFLSKKNQKYLNIFIDQVILKFSIFMELCSSEEGERIFYQEVLGVFSPNLQNLICSIRAHQESRLFWSPYFYEFLGNLLLKDFNIEIDVIFSMKFNHQQLHNKETLFQVYLKQIQCINKLFSFQKFNSDYFKLIKIYFEVVFDKCPKILNYMSKYPSKPLILNQQKDPLYLTQFLNCILGITELDYNIFWNSLYMVFFLEQKHQLVDSTSQNYLNKMTYFLLEKRRIINNFQYIPKGINMIFDLLDSKKLQYVFIDLLSDLFHLTKEEAVNYDVLINIYWQKLDSKKLLDMQKNSKIENLMDTLTSLQHKSESFNALIKSMFLNRLNDDYLTEEHVSRLYKLLQSSPQNFYEIFQEIICKLRKNERSKDLVLHVNLIHLVKVMEWECFGEQYDEALNQRYAQVLNECLDYLQMRNFFYFADEYTEQDMEAKQIGNINFLPYGGLLRLFTQMIITANRRGHQDFVISIALKLLNIYLDYLQKPLNDDSFINQIYAHFKCRRDLKGIAFPIIIYIFKKDFQIMKEHLSNQKKVLDDLLEKCHDCLIQSVKQIRFFYLEQQQLQYSRFQKQNILIKEKTEKICNLEKKGTQSQISFGDISTNLGSQIDQYQLNKSIKFVEQVDIQICPNYRSFYLYHDIQNSEAKFSGIRQILEQSLKLEFKDSQKQNLIFFQTSTLDFENRIIFSESQSEKSEYTINLSENSIDLKEKKTNILVTLQSNNTAISVLKTISKEQSILIRHKDLQCIKEFNINFHDKQSFQNFLKECQKKEIFYCINPVDDFRDIIQEKWIDGKLSNYQYIFLLNHYGGRNLLDVNNYYIFPWICQNFYEKSLVCDRKLFSTYYKTDNPKNFLYFSNSEQMNIFKGRGEYLVDFLNKIQAKGEALPEIYTSVHFFKNFKFPSWVPTETSEEFIYIMRQQLEQQSVQTNLHHWIDIVFGIYSNQKGSKKKDTTICHYYDILQDSDKTQLIKQYGQSPKQIFINQHPRRQLICHQYENQKKWNLDVKNLLLEVDEKIISIYHQPFCYMFVITEQGMAYVIETEEQLMLHLIEKKGLRTVQKKSLQAMSKLNQNLVAYIDFDNQLLPDNQESQSHFIEHTSWGLFTKPSIFIVVAGYKNEFQVFQGAQMKFAQVCHTNDIVTCIKFCHYRQTLIVGQRDSKIGLWKVKKPGEIQDQYCMISSHNAPIVAIDFSATKILSIDSINEAHVHYYDGQLITVILLDTVGRINYCSISYTMNLYIFMDSFNQLMAYTVTGEKYIEPQEYLQQITTLLPLTKFSSQFFFSTKGDLYFDDFFNIKLQQLGKSLSEEQHQRVYNYNFRNLKSLKQGSLLPNNDNSAISASAITMMSSHEICYIFFGCEDGKLWCAYQEDQITAQITKKLQRSGLIEKKI